jgi:repressor LexA
MYSTFLPMNKVLTLEQKKVFDYLVATQQETGAPPTVREICTYFGYRSPNNAQQHLRLIEKKGYIRRLPGRSRGIELTAVASVEHNETVDVPIVGTIAAGTPLTAVENVDGSIALDRNMFGNDDIFSLRVKGDSMKNAGIFNGDIAIIRVQPQVDDGEIAAVIIEDEATLKRVIREDGRVVLRAENPDFQDIVVPPDRQIAIAGKLRGVMRKC